MVKFAQVDENQIGQKAKNFGRVLQSINNRAKSAVKKFNKKARDYKNAVKRQIRSWVRTINSHTGLLNGTDLEAPNPEILIKMDNFFIVKLDISTSTVESWVNYEECLRYRNGVTLNRSVSIDQIGVKIETFPFIIFRFLERIEVEAFGRHLIFNTRKNMEGENLTVQMNFK